MSIVNPEAPLRVALFEPEYPRTRETLLAHVQHSSYLYR